MTFLIRQISRTADGREIIRTSTSEATSIVVGRDAACAIHLADLGVEMQHANIALLKGDMVLVSALGSLGFLENGRQSHSATIETRVGAELRFGSHRLTIGQDAAAVTITVERVEALSDSSEEKDEAALFTLKGLLPGRRISAWAFAGLVLAAFLVWPIYSYVASAGVKERPAGYHGDQAWMSGPLSTAHKGLSDNCQACHTESFVAVTDKACVTCHKDAHDHAEPARLAVAKGEPGIGGKLLTGIAHGFNRPDGRCVACHTEHEGAGPMQPTAQQFCTDCHDGLKTRLTDTKIADAGDFGKDHPEFNVRIMDISGGTPRLSRVSLAQKPADDSGLKFPHDTHLSRTGGVARMAQTMRGQFGFGDALACKDCHTPTADGVRFQPVDMEQDCAMCHSLGFEKIGGTVRTLRHGELAQVIADLRAFYRAGGPPPSINLSGNSRRRPGDFAQGAPYYANFGRGSANYSSADAAIRSVFSKGGACYDCHVITPPPAGSDNWRVQPVHQQLRYMTNGWFTHEAHKTEKCESCHVAGKSQKATDLLLPGIATCRECHGGEASRADVPSACAMCHSYHADDGAPWVSNHRVAKRTVNAALRK